MNKLVFIFLIFSFSAFAANSAKVTMTATIRFENVATLSEKTIKNKNFGQIEQIPDIQNINNNENIEVTASDLFANADYKPNEIIVILK